MTASSPALSHRRPPRVRRAAAALATVTALGLVSCGSDDDSSADDVAGSSVGASLAADALAQFYPLVFATERIGGDVVRVVSLTPPGVEPHDFELTPHDTAALHDASIVVYLDGFSPAVDAAVDDLDDAQAFDVADFARLDIETDTAASEDAHEHDEADHDDESDHEDHDESDHEDHDEADHEDHDHGGNDPHFWLDPTRLADVADAIAEQFTEVAPEHADEFEANAEALRVELEALDDEFSTGLAACESRDLVTSHTAFAYLAQRYDLNQIGVTGITPHEEPSPQTLAEVIHFVETHDVSTIYTETLVDPAIAETVAAETGATTAVLDPLEGLTDDSAGDDYFSVMRANLESLREGQRCS